jgi:hypothetical protein
MSNSILEHPLNMHIIQPVTIITQLFCMQLFKYYILWVCQPFSASAATDQIRQIAAKHSLDYSATDDSVHKKGDQIRRNYDFNFTSQLSFISILLILNVLSCCLTRTVEVEYDMVLNKKSRGFI